MGEGRLLTSELLNPRSRVQRRCSPPFLLELQLLGGGQTHHSETEIRLKMGSRRAAGGCDGPNTPASKTGESEPPRLLPLLP